MKTSTCRSCGASVIWVVLPSGKRCPVDATGYTLETFPPGSTPVYTLSEHPGGDVVATALDKEALAPTQRFHVSHFATCPNARQHSSKGKA